MIGAQSESCCDHRQLNGAEGLQPVYRLAVRNSVKNFLPTGAGWYVELEQVQPA